MAPLQLWLKGGLYFLACALAVIGIFLVRTWWTTRHGTDRWLSGHDAILGVQNQTMLLVMGLLHFAFAVYLFVARDLLNRYLFVLWAALNHAVYYFGLHFMEPMALLETERFLGWRLRLTPESVEIRWKLLQGGLVFLSVAAITTILLDARRNSAILKQEQWFRNWQARRKERNPRKTADIARPGEEYVKVACSGCGQKIAFPISRAGEKIACPKCAIQVVLLKP